MHDTTTKNNIKILHDVFISCVGVQITSKKLSQFKGEMLQLEENKWYRKHLETLSSTVV